MNRCTERLYNGIVKENPTFVQMLGMCPTLAVTTSAVNGVGMGLTTTVILVMSNLMISLLRKLIPNRVRIPAFIIVIASFVTIVQFLLEGFIPSLYDSLGIFIPLIVVNCIILGRAEAYASKNPVLPSVFDGIGMGLGFTVGLTAIGAFRELLGNGTIFNFKVMPGGYQPITIFILAPGAFFVLAFLIAFQNKMALNKAAKAGTPYEICRDADCGHCTNTMCGGRFFDFGTKEGESADVERETTEYAAQEAAADKEAAEASAAGVAKAFEAQENPNRQGAGENIGGEVLKQESADGGEEPEASPIAGEGEPEAPPAFGEGEPETPPAFGEGGAKAPPADGKDSPEAESGQPESGTKKLKAEEAKEDTDQSDEKSADGETGQLKAEEAKEDIDPSEVESADGETKKLKAEEAKEDIDPSEVESADGETAELDGKAADGETGRLDAKAADGETGRLDAKAADGETARLDAKSPETKKAREEEDA